MLYFKALLEGLSEFPSADKNLRLALEKEALVLGWPAMHKKLSQLDPQTAERIKQTDSQRIQRALEICMLTKKSVSELIHNSQHTVDFPIKPSKLRYPPVIEACYISGLQHVSRQC